MKKVLLIVGMFALLASCSRDNFENTGVTPDAPKGGITFTATDAAATKGQYDKIGSQWFTTWYGEIDQIGVTFSAGAKVTAANDPLNAAWDKGIAQYKATRSESNGYFTAVDDANILNWTADTASFRVFYPYQTQTPVSVAGDPLSLTVLLPQLAQQAATLTDSKLANDELMDASFSSSFMTSVDPSALNALAAPMNHETAGQAIPIVFERQFPILYFSITGYDEIVAAGLGNLISIELTAATSDIAFSGNSTIDLTTKEVTRDTPVKVAKLTIDGGQFWNENSTAFMTVDAIGEDAIGQEFTVVYTFKNAAITKEFTGTSAWEAGQFKKVAPLDLTTVPYLVTGAANNYALIINDAFTGSLASIIKADGDNSNELSIVDPSNATKFACTVADLKALGSRKALSSADLATLNAATGLGTAPLVELYLYNNTSIINPLVGAATAATLENVILPKVTALPTSTATTSLFGVMPKLKYVELSSVTAINEFAFTSANTALAEVDVENLTTIGKNAFNGVARLVEIDLTKVTTIGDNAFNGVARLVEIDLTKVTTIGDNAFKGAAALVAAKLPALTSLGKGAFDGATLLDEVVLGDAVTTIPDLAFNGTALKKLTAKGVTTISNGGATPANAAFNGIATLEEVILPAYAFDDSKVYNQILDKSKLKFADISAVDKIGSEFAVNYVTFNGFTVLEKITLKSGVNILDNAFLGCVKLATVNNFASAARVGNNSFKGCALLTKAYVNGTSVGEGAFDGCTVLKDVVLGAAVTEIKKSAFANSGVVNINTAKVTLLGEKAFNAATSLVTLDLSKLGKAGVSAFEGCTSLGGASKFVLPVATISTSMLKGCTSLQYVEFSNLTTLSEGTGILDGANAIKAVKFTNNISATGGQYVATTFGTVNGKTGIDAANKYTFELFVNGTQKGADFVNGTWVLGGTTLTHFTAVVENE